MKPVLHAAVFSDTHSNNALMLETIRRTRPDIVIHLGDYERDAERIRSEFPDIALFNVSGNCDMFPSSPSADIVPLGPVKAFITHGHLYNVEWGDLSRLAYAAEEQGAKLALYGHTHRAENTDLGSIRVVNPGTAGRGRDLTWARIEVYENGGFTAEIVSL
ncbi:MAG: YfcE family phosphodiesterase [Oscillospiraceae bacterium]|nr:YfcE family phosphodiesterase [Oscillospiraceae bacterium]